MKDADLRSLPPAERLPVLDILRGFALMGILIMNMPIFGSSAFAEADGSHLWPGRADQLAAQVRDALFSGKFNSMFSLLFGIGFTVQYARMQEREPAHASNLYLRRLGALFVFGVIHAVFFWTGDILHMYAVLGVVMVFGVRRVSDRALVGLIVAGLLYPALSGVLRVLLISKEMVAQRVLEAQSFEASNNAAYGHGSFIATVVENARVMLHDYSGALNLWSMFGAYVMIAVTMLLGVLAGRRRWVQRVPELMPQIRRLMWWALALGLACGVAFTVIFELNRAPGPSLIKVLGSVCYSLSRLALMCFYVLLIVRLAQKTRWQQRFAPMAVVGRMPLTNYLMQTVICTTLFYGWGFGLWMKVGPALGLVLAFAIFFIVQVPFSRWWSKRHERGPMEALWARLTYGARVMPPAVVLSKGVPPAS